MLPDPHPELITVLWSVPLIGTNGTHKTFLSRHQYPVIGEIKAGTPMLDEFLYWHDLVQDCYVIHIGDEDFYIDKNNAQYEGRIREPWEQDWYVYKEMKPWPRVKNYHETYLQVYGIDLKKASGRQDNGYDVWKNFQPKEIGIEE